MPPARSSFGPTPIERRIELIDILRGFALFGVLLANMIWLSQSVATTHEQLKILPTAAVDPFIRKIVRFFIDGKFYTLFAFLFGLGFSLQLNRARSTGLDLLPTYTRRILVLFGLGLSHALLLWYGDILHIYAFLGLFLLFFRRIGNKSLLTVGFAFAVVIPVLIQIFQDLAPPLDFLTGISASVSTVVAGDNIWTPYSRFEAFTEGPYRRMILANADVLVTNIYLSGYALHYLPAIFGKFLIGMYAGRLRILQNASQNVSFFRKLLKWGLIFSIAGNGLWLLQDLLFRWDIMEETSRWAAAFYFPIAIGMISLAGVYLSALVLLYQNPGWKRRLALLAPVGRMALTNYLVQTVAFLLIFYGVGLNLMGKVGATACVIFSIILFFAQTVLSNWWLRYFKFGPAEWVWRTLTYGQIQSIREPRTRTSVPTTKTI